MGGLKPVTARGLRHTDRVMKSNYIGYEQKREERSCPSGPARCLTSLISSRYDQSAAGALP